MKRFIKLSVVFVLLVAITFSLVACGDKTVYYTDMTGNWEFTLDENGKATLTAYKGQSENVVIPASVNHADGTAHDVLWLADGLFVAYTDKGIYDENKLVKTVTFDANCLVEEIPFRTFYMCTALESVSFNKEMKSIKDFAFYGCSSLESITITQQISSLGAYTFLRCTALKDVYIYSDFIHGTKELNIPKIGDRCFFLIDDAKKDDSQYYVSKDLKIHVKDVSAYSESIINEHKKETKSQDYKYWNYYNSGDNNRLVPLA